MKHFLRFLAVLTIIALLITNTFIAFAFPSHKDHDKMMEEILFPLHEHDLKKNAKTAEYIEMIEYASYLAIDQVNSLGQGKLNSLKNYGVKGLPSTVEELGKGVFAGNHRKASHLGWDDINYNNNENELIAWQKRKAILVNTVDKIFDFNGQEAKKDSFCALIYYIHILGDKYDDCQQNKYNPPAEIIEIGGRINDKNCIIDEMLKHMKVLFKDQCHSSNYLHIFSELEKINSKLRTINFDNLKDSTSNDFKLYTECVSKTVSIFKSNNCNKEEQFSMLLKGEPFFNKVFYNHPY